ncbi:MAG: hypothetical protein RSE58_12775 [Clostridia bacterium]
MKHGTTQNTSQNQEKLTADEAPFANPKFRTWLAWLIGAALAAALLSCLYFWGALRFANNDDAYILRTFMTPVNGKITAFNMCLHPLLCYPLAWLGTLAPSIAWFSWLQLALLWLSMTVGVKSLLVISRRHWNRYGLWAGLGISLVFLFVFCFKYSALVTFTVTAAMLGAAAVLQLLSVDAARATDGQMLRSAALALVLVILAYGLRQIVALPILAFCGIAFLLQWLRRGKGARPLPMVLAMAAVLMTLGALTAWRNADVRAQGADGYMRWQDASSVVLDYAGLNDLPPELLAEIGWSEAERALVNEWYFMDQNISTEAFESIAGYQATQKTDGMAAALGGGLRRFGTLMQKERAMREAVWLLCGLFVLCGAGLLMKRKGTLWLWLALASTLLCTAALLIYLGVGGRLPLRAAMTALLPAAGMLFGLVPSCLNLDASKRGGSLVLVLLACACLVPAVLCTRTVLADIRPPVASAENEGLNAYADLDEYAVENPDQLFVTDMTLVMDSRMFPAAAEEGLPANVLFWGGWGNRSPLYMAQLEAFGFDGASMDATLFLEDNVRLARGMLDPPPQRLMDYLSELSGGEVDYAFDADWGGIHIFQLY